MIKEAYFTPRTITAQGAALRSRAEALIQRRQPTFIPERSVLLALDLQRFFFDPASHAFILSAPAILPGIHALIQAFRQSGLPVLFTRHLNTADDAGMMSSWWRDLISPGDPLSHLLPSLETGAQEIVKSQYDAFYQTNLEDRLHTLGVHQVLVSGVMAHLCCDTTARAAFVRGFEVFILVDGMATYNEQLHYASLLNLAHGFATPLLVGEALAAVQELKPVQNDQL